MAREVNLREAAISVFRTIDALERSYGAEYLSRILQGFDLYGLKDASHRELETFGDLSELFRDRIINIINLLVRRGYLKVTDARFGNLSLAEKAQAFLASPEDILVPARVIETSEWNRMLASELRHIRWDLSEREQVMPYEIFTNFSLQCILDRWPEKVSDLKAIEGLEDKKVDRYGPAILQAVGRIRKKRTAILAERRKKRAQMPSHQKTKDLFLAGKNLEEIAADRCIQSVTVLRYLETLHLTGEIDLSSWIENQVSQQDLEKGISYFQEAEDRRLKVAYENLGLDYETLRMCRLYVSNYLQSDDELALAG